MSRAERLRPSVLAALYNVCSTSDQEGLPAAFQALDVPFEEIGHGAGARVADHLDAAPFQDGFREVFVENLARSGRAIARDRSRSWIWFAGRRATAGPSTRRSRASAWVGGKEHKSARAAAFAVA